MMLWLILLVVTCVLAEDANDAYKDQYCTDPRTMKKHAAYTEWADAYSCTRHRCQPGGRNLAIYTVGCRRVEAPESAIECEEVVEDTNMQFPYCCTRLRCLVVVRGEVWTRVLGQPWETLPAAPWSHMYKMKKPPPGNEFLPKSGAEGPVYELTDSDNEKPREKVLRASKQVTSDPNCNEVVPRAAPSPDIVIALTTNNDQKEPQHSKDFIKPEKSERKHHSKPPSMSQYYEEEVPEVREVEPEEPSTEKPLEVSEENRDGRDYYSYSYGPTQKPKSSHHRSSWTEVPPAQWNERDSIVEETAPPKFIQQPQQPSYQEPSYHQSEPMVQEPEKKLEKPANLQALVDAIGTRMRDIENVVQKMSEKVHQAKPEEEASGEKNLQHESEQAAHSKYSQERKAKKPNADGDHYKRFTVKNRGSKYLHGNGDVSTDAPVYMEDNGNGYFSDASNSVLRRSNPRIEPKVLAKEPSQPPTYMAPVENRRKAHSSQTSASEEKVNKKRRKRTHKKKKRQGKAHKRHHKDGEKKRKFSRANSVENDRIVISLEDSSAGQNKKK